MMTSDMRSGITAMSTATLISLFTEIGAELVMRNSARNFDMEMLQHADEPGPSVRLREWATYGTDAYTSAHVLGNRFADIAGIVIDRQVSMDIEELNKRCKTARAEQDTASA